MFDVYVDGAERDEQKGKKINCENYLKKKNHRLNSHTVCNATRSFRRRYFVALRRARLRPARRTIKRRPAERPIPLYKSPPCVLEPAHYPLTTPFP